jgi:hypothetical protein
MRKRRKMRKPTEVSAKLRAPRRARARADAKTLPHSVRLTLPKVDFSHGTHRKQARGGTDYLRMGL